MNRFLYKQLSRFISYMLIIFLFTGLSSCKKILDAKPDQKINTPTTLADLQALVDYYYTVNSWSPVIGELASDDYYLPDASWASASSQDRDFYLWIKNDDIRADWNFSYNAINYGNTILDYLPKVTVQSGQYQQSQEIKGAGHFIRGFYHYMLAQLFAPVYNKATADKDLGLPLSQTSDINAISVRSTVEVTYNTIIDDIKTAISLLPETAAYKSRPSKAAAYGLLARVYLSMQEYRNAGLYADSCLQLYNSLMDYNKLNASAAIPFVQFNDEVIYDSRCVTASPLTRARSRIDSSLYRSYDDNDIRKSIFFVRNSNDGAYSFKGNYAGVSSNAFFTGIATDEMYLIRAECAARNHNIQQALDDINMLLQKRFKTGRFIPISIADPAALLAFILSERRKELVSRTLRWTDLRRLNLETQFAKTLYRKINGQMYNLEPNSLRYTFQISKTAVQLSDMPQNP